MHTAHCPTCNTRIQLDFKPVAGLIWCPTCQKTFCYSGASETESEKPDEKMNDGDGSES
jgi:uncharacterized Zn finger protein (UPF0148 family)